MGLGNNSIEDHIAHYKVLCKSQISETSLFAIGYFRRSLNIPLQRKLLELPTPPANLQGWYDWASRLDNNVQKMQRILEEASRKTSEKGKEKPT